MTHSRTLTVPEMILELLHERTIPSISFLRAEIDRRHNREISPGSLRVHLHTLFAKGKISRYAQGAYCLKGREPKPVALADWLLEDLQALWPAAPDIGTMRQRFKRVHKYAPTYDDVRAAVEGLLMAKKLRALGGGYAAVESAYDAAKKQPHNPFAD